MTYGDTHKRAVLHSGAAQEKAAKTSQATNRGKSQAAPGARVSRATSSAVKNDPPSAANPMGGSSAVTKGIPVQDELYHNGATPQAIQPGRKNFAIVPSRIIFDQRLSERAKVILMAIASNANPQRVCQVRQDTLAKRLGYRRESILRSVAQLALFGYLEVIHLGAEGEHRGRTANGYVLLFDQYGGPLPPDDGTRAQTLREKSHKSPTPISVTRRSHKSPNNVTPAAHKSEYLSDVESTQIFMCAPDHSKEADLCDAQVTTLTESLYGGLTESVYGEESALVSVPETKGEQKGSDARAREPEAISTDLRASLDPKKHERRDLWQRIIGVLNVRRADRQEWLDPCTLYEPTPHNFLLVAPTRAEKVYVDLHWGIAIWRELNLMHQTDDCTLALDYGAPPNAHARTTVAS